MKTQMKVTLFTLLLAGLLALSLALGPVHTVQAQSGCTVTSDLDDDNTSGTLRALIADGTCETITFAGDTTIHLKGPLTIDHKLTVDGSGYQVVISGDSNGDKIGETYLFDIPAGVVATLQNLALEYGSGKPDEIGRLNGGAIYNQGTLTVTNSTFSNNSAASGGLYPNTGNGGAIYNAEYGTLTVMGSVFSNNSATGSGGAIYDLAYNTLVVAGSTFSGNSANNGGAIRDNYQGNLTVTDTIFSANSATSDGGAIMIRSSATLTGSVFSGNSARSGGAIANYGTLTVTGSTFSGNSASFQGGGIADWGTLTVTGSTLSGNSAIQGGGIFENRPTTTVDNSIIANSTGGNCYLEFDPISSGSSNLADDESCGYFFTNSSALLLGSLGNYGGSTQTVPLLPGSAAIDAGNSANCESTDQRGVARVGVCDIGAFESQGFSLAAVSGSDQITALGTAFPSPLVVSVTSASGEPVDGGQVTFTAPAEGASTDPAVNTATISGGQASLSATANSTNGGYDVAASAAGGSSVSFYLVSGCLDSPVVTNGNDSGSGSLRQAITFACSGNTIGFAGDTTIHLANQLTLSRDVTIDGSGHSVVLSGDTNDDGSGDVRVFYVNTGVTAALQHLTIEKGNAANSGGGGIYNKGTLTVSNITFSGNSAEFGGGIANNWPGTLAITGSTFSGNTATLGSGGAIYNTKNLTVSESTFSGNTAAQEGGGISNYYGATLTVTGSTFSGNSATSNGGGIANSGSLWVNNTTLSGNSATSGGGIYNGGTLDVTASTFSGNSASQGGGIYNNNNTSNAAIFHNSLIANSTGGNCSGHIYGISSGDIRYNRADDASCGTDFPSNSTLLLGSLGNYGGSTQTIPLLPGSFAIDRGGTCPAADQRGVARVGACDMGAFESQGFSLARISGNLQSAPVNTAFTNPLVVSVTSTHGEPVDGGQVTFAATVGTTGASATLTGSPAAITGGQASVTATANSSIGMYTLVASTKHLLSTQPEFTLNNTKVPATVTLTSSPNPSSYRQRVTFTATVSGGSSGVIPTGTVTFYENVPYDAQQSSQAQLAGATTGGNVVALTDGVATFTTSSLSVGSHSIVALYSGDATYDYNTSDPLSQGVSKSPAVITQPLSQTVAEGSEVSFSAEAIGYPEMSVQWQLSTDSGKNWTNIDGATAVPLTFTASITQNGNQYRAVFTNSLGSVTSDPATLTVNAVSGMGSISGLVFNDTNGNGTQDRSEAGMAGWTVQLMSVDGSLIQEVVTDSGGVYNYSFSTQSGVFRARLAQPLQSGYIQTTPDPADITLADGQAVTGVNFGAVVSADLKVSMDTVYDSGAKTIVYTITVTNDGPAEAVAASLKDSLSRHVDFISATSTLGSCSNIRGTVTCSFGNLAPGSSATVTLTVSRTSTKYAIVNTTIVSSSIFDIDKADNTVSATVK